MEKKNTTIKNAMSKMRTAKATAPIQFRPTKTHSHQKNAEAVNKFQLFVIVLCRRFNWHNWRLTLTFDNLFKNNGPIRPFSLLFRLQILCTSYSVFQLTFPYI